MPVNAPGVKIINRSFAPAEADPFDYPASAQPSMPEGFVMFDDVFVPWDRVFLAGEVPLAAGSRSRSGCGSAPAAWSRRCAERTVRRTGPAGHGECRARTSDPIAQASIAELITYAEMLRMGLDYACRNFETTPSGMVLPNMLAINAAKYYYAANYHQTVRHLHDLGGGLVLTLPRESDLRERGDRPYIRKYLHTKTGVDVETADAGLQHDPRPDRGRLRRLAAGRGAAGGRRPAGATPDDEPHLQHEAAKENALKAAGALPARNTNH